MLHVGLLLKNINHQLFFTNLLNIMLHFLYTLLKEQLMEEGKELKRMNCRSAEVPFQ